MLTNFITFLFTAIAAFLLGFTLQPNNIAFKATMTPVVILDETIQSPTNKVSLNLSFEIHRPRAMDLTEAVSTISTECQELYKIYEPVAIDLFNTASDELVQNLQDIPTTWHGTCSKIFVHMQWICLTSSSSLRNANNSSTRSMDLLLKVHRLPVLFSPMDESRLWRL
jgi:uncharacterized membrane-anchored protein YitT (DUF2179 family)